MKTTTVYSVQEAYNLGYEDGFNSCFSHTVQTRYVEMANDEPEEEFDSAFVFNFPAKNKKRGSAYEQLKHASGEIVEAVAEHKAIDKAVEVLDAIECLEGALRKLEESKPGITDKAMMVHYRKNTNRGYYG